MIKLILPLLLFFGCGVKFTGKYFAHPPRPNENCEAQDREFYKWADEIGAKYTVIPMLTPGQSPQDLIKLFKQVIENNNFKIRKKPGELKGDFWRASTALPGIIWTGNKLDSKSDIAQASNLGHEVGHMLFYVARGYVEAGEMYASEHGRLAFEFPQYIATFKIFWMFTEPTRENFEKHKAMVIRSARRFSGLYQIKRFTPECTAKMAVKYYETRYLNQLETSILIQDSVLVGE